MRSALFHGERGSITVEFIVLAPSLVLLVYLATMLNEYVERRQTLDIASRNVAALAPNANTQASTSDQVFSKSVQKDFFGTELTAGDADTIKVIRDPELSDAFKVAAGVAPLTANTEASAGVLLDAQRYYANDDSHCDTIPSDGHGPQFCPYSRESVAYPGPFASLSGVVGGIASTGSQIVDPIVNSPVFFNGNDRRLVTQTSLSIPGSAGLMNRAVAGLFALATGADREPFLASAATHYTMAFTTLHYSRPFVGFHLTEDEYTYEFPLGIGLDLLLNRVSDDKWGDTGDLSRGVPSWFQTLPGGFTTNCMFYYMGGSDCQSFTSYRMVVDIVAGVATIVDIISKIGGGDSKEAWDQATEYIQSKGIDAVKDTIISGVTEAAKEKLDGLEATLLTKLTDAIDGPLTSLQGTLVGNAAQFSNCVAADPTTSGCP